MTHAARQLSHRQAAARRFVLVLCMAALVGFGAGCTTGINPVSGNQRAYAYTWEEEQQIGARADEQIAAQFGVYDDPALQEYVDRVGQRVLAESDLRDPGTAEKFREAEFTFRVLDSPVVNAFALPGGYVYVTRGLMAHLNNEAQLAVVLGHEIAHVAARHASAQAAKAQLTQLGLLGGAILGQQVFGLPGGNLLRLGRLGTQLLFLEYSRDNELESDDLGVEYAAKAGYEVGEAAAFFESLERIQVAGGQVLPTWLSTHPDPGNREARILEMAAEWEERAQTTIIDQEQYYAMLEGVVMGQNPRQGFTEGGVFYHPGLAFAFPVPSNFRVQNAASQVVMVDPEGRAQLIFTFAGAGSPSEAAAQIVQEAAGQRGVSVLDRGADPAAGLPARYVLLGGQTQQGQEIRLLYYFLEYDGTVYAFQGATAAQSFGAFEDVFLRTMRGFGPLTDPQILSIQPTRIEVGTAQRTAPFRSFVNESELPMEMDAQGLAILNQLRLDTRIGAGAALKLPER